MSDTGNDSDTGTIPTSKPKSNTLSIVSTIAIWGFILALLIMVILMLVFGYQKDLPKRLFPETDIEGDLIVQGKLARYNDNVVEVDSGTGGFTLTQEDSGKIYYINDNANRQFTLPSNCKSGTNYKFLQNNPDTTNPNVTSIFSTTNNFYGHAIVGSDGTSPKMYDASESGSFVPSGGDGSQIPYQSNAKFIRTGTSWNVSAYITTTGVISKTPFELFN